MRILTAGLVFSLLVSGLCAQFVEAKTARERRHLAQTKNVLKSQRLSVKWDGLTLDEVASDLRDRLGINLLVARAARDIAGDVDVSLTLTRFPAWELLRILSEQHDLGFRQLGSVLVMTTRDDLVRRSMVTRVYSASLLGYRPPNFPGPRLGLDLTDPSERERPTVESRSYDPETDVATIRNMTGSSRWEIEGALMEVSGRLLIVRHTPSMQRKVEQSMRLLGAY